VGRGGAVCALDQGWGAAVAAVDGEPKSRRRSGEVWWSEQERMSEMCVCKRKSECARNSRMCSGYKRRCGGAGAGAGTPAGGCGSSGDGDATWGKQGRPARGREGGGKVGEGIWLGAVRRGGGGGAAQGRQERRRRIGQRTEEEEGR
jgi:hypothetical protein